jgi:hypothetical protein
MPTLFHRRIPFELSPTASDAVTDTEDEGEDEGEDAWGRLEANYESDYGSDYGFESEVIEVSERTNEVSAWSDVWTELAVKPARCCFEFAESTETATEGAAEARVNCTDCTECTTGFSPAYSSGYSASCGSGSGSESGSDSGWGADDGEWASMGSVGVSFQEVVVCDDGDHWQLMDRSRECIPLRFAHQQELREIRPDLEFKKLRDTEKRKRVQQLKQALGCVEVLNPSAGRGRHMAAKMQAAGTLQVQLMAALQTLPRKTKPHRATRKHGHPPRRALWCRT